MKDFYRLSFYVSLVLLLSSFIYPPIHGIPIERRLLRADQWEFKFTSPDHLLLGTTEGVSKTKLVEFLRFYNHTYAYGIAWLSTALLVSTIFSFIGWRREICLEKRGAPNAASC